MSRLSPSAFWAIAVGVAALSVAVAAAQVGRPPGRDPAQTVRVFEGVSTEGDFQQALDRAVGRALRSLPGADRMVQYRVRDITGEQGGIRGVNTLRVSIEVTGDEPRLPDRPPVEPDPVRPPPPDPQPAGEDLRRALDVQLRLPQPRVPRGDAVTLELTVRNISARPVRVPFASAQQYDFEIWRANRLVYRWSQGRVFAQALTALSLTPGQAITFTGRWDQRSADGLRVAAGDYTVRGYLPTRPTDPSEAAGLRIGDTAPLTITAR